MGQVPEVLILVLIRFFLDGRIRVNPTGSETLVVVVLGPDPDPDEDPTFFSTDPDPAQLEKNIPDPT